MKLMVGIAVVVVMVAVAAASPAKTLGRLEFPAAVLDRLEKADPGNANNYIDLVLFELNKLLPPRIDLPDIGGTFDLHDCYVFGLDNGVHRSGDATMVTVEETVKFSAAFYMKDLGLTCTWKYMLMRGDAGGSTALVDISSAISLQLTSGSSPQLTEFRVVQMAPIETDITGLTIAFNWLAEDIADFIINSYGEQIIYVVEHQVKDLLQYVLDQIVIP